MKGSLNQSLPNDLKQLAAKSARTRAQALQSLAATKFARLSEVAIQALSDRSPLVRTAAIEVLADSDERLAISKIRRLLNDPNAEVRMRAAEALGTLPSEGKIPKHLIQLLNDKDVLVRVAAAESLGLLRCRRSLPALRQALNDRSALVRSYVAEALGRIGEKRDVPLLKNALESEGNEIARVGVLKGLYEMGEKGALQGLLTLLTSGKDYRARCAAANGLGALSLNNSDRQTSVKSLSRALRSERTVAARSSMRSSLKTLNGDNGT